MDYHMKITSLVSLIGFLGVLLFGSLWFASSYEKLENSQTAVQEATSNYDEFIDKDIIFCMENNNSECEEIMREWHALCQQDDHKGMPSCEDGRLENYLKIHKVEGIPKGKYDFSIEGREFSSDSKRLLDSCEQSAKYLSEMIVEYGMGEPETIKAAELTKSCMESINDLRNKCVQLRSAGITYPIICDDTRLS